MKVFGEVTSVRVVKNKATGESRGFAFVDFGTVEEARLLFEHYPTGSSRLLSLLEHVANHRAQVPSSSTGPPSCCSTDGPMGSRRVGATTMGIILQERTGFVGK
jgi:RNA recognition motif-containing protein